MSEPAKYIVVGNGYRSQFFLKLASHLPEVELAGIVVRRQETVDELAGRWGVPVSISLDDMISKVRPSFIVTGTPWDVTPVVAEAAVERGIPVLAETPPAPDAEGLRGLWAAVGKSGLVQVAEQYLMYPGHAARLALVRSGLLGQPTSVQVSSTHGYHAVSMIRGLLGVGFEPVTVRANAFHSPLINPLTREGWTDDVITTHEVETMIATLDFGGPMGLYDFTTLQWRNFLRSRRILIRCSAGEIAEDSVMHMVDPRTFVRSDIVRRQMGYDMDFNGFETVNLSHEGTVLYRNPFIGERLSDDEIGISSLLVGMARWTRDEAEPPYPLAQGSQDQLISLAIDESAKIGQPVTTRVETWAKGA